MAVVPTGVHHARRLRAVGHIVLLVDRQRIHIKTQQHRALPRLAAAEQANHAGLADAGHHLIAQRPKLLGDHTRGADLLEAKLGVHMQVAPDSDQLVVECLGLGEKWCGHRLLLSLCGRWWG
jgi:hypothetical protein